MVPTLNLCVKCIHKEKKEVKRRNKVRCRNEAKHRNEVRRAGKEKSRNNK